MLKLWFKRVGPADGNVPPNVEYIYFDQNEWQRQYFVGNVQMIVSRRLLLNRYGWICVQDDDATMK